MANSISSGKFVCLKFYLLATNTILQFLWGKTDGASSGMS